MEFPPTRWTLIAQLNDPVQLDAALDQLCRAYWEPIYAYLRQSGHGHAETQDLTQEFLGMVLRQRLLERADPAAGRLRSWLLAALHHFVANARRHESRLKRGAGLTVLPLDHADVLPELQETPAPGPSPDEAFDRAWVAVLLRRVLETLTGQYRGTGRAAELQTLLPWLLDNGPVPRGGSRRVGRDERRHLSRAPAPPPRPLPGNAAAGGRRDPGAAGGLPAGNRIPLPHRRVTALEAHGGACPSGAGLDSPCNSGGQMNL